MPHLQFQALVRRAGLLLLLPAILGFVLAVSSQTRVAKAQAGGASRSLTLRSDIQEANAKTGVITARGNVQINYPARQIQATAAQAQYFSRERRIVLTGNVYVLQQGNSLRGEVITYLIDEGRFVAVPATEQQVEATYIVIDPEPTASPAPAPVPLEPISPASDSPASTPSRSTQP
ncbi:hypothetical protein BST81_13645 [Leptolyngbya sp. 'hensonii']|uniref:LptA/OstA family protein n=1 Tax=Leptolyngbya sp. 'hensonii' TaxID=1922337 RepID=UPI00095010CD|nr:LptA/OstA family protein [Leptolyngbya sp. 'hensonii']OLP18066.1 hypothetical protein BST81_13645 [Leptolyngbya sp. 'hensonii']